jgi:hypothetical protein
MEAIHHETDSVSPEPDSKRRKLRKGTKSVCNIPVQRVQVPALKMPEALCIITETRHNSRNDRAMFRARLSVLCAVLSCANMAAVFSAGIARNGR